MCGLFGFSDPKNSLSARQKNRLLNALACASEVRGTDATGIAYNAGGKLRIFKRPKAAHALKMLLPPQVSVCMGHTRMTTQGSECNNQNNHPFAGTVGAHCFALAHNGVLRNDGALRKEHRLPKTPIETDSYVAVQLLEQSKKICMDILIIPSI